MVLPVPGPALSRSAVLMAGPLGQGAARDGLPVLLATASGRRGGGPGGQDVADLQREILVTRTVHRPGGLP